MAKKVLFIFLLLGAFLCLGCNNLGKVETKNIPFTILEQGNYTLEALTQAAPEPVIAVFDSQTDFAKAYNLITQDTKDLSINWDKELVVIVLRGSRGACKNAGIDIKKISQEKAFAEIEVLVDNGQTEKEACSVDLNPYMIIKTNQDQFISYNDLTYQLIDNNKDVLAEDTISIIPEFLK
jgi:hypothetical protein